MISFSNFFAVFNILLVRKSIFASKMLDTRILLCKIYSDSYLLFLMFFYFVKKQRTFLLSKNRTKALKTLCLTSQTKGLDFVKITKNALLCATVLLSKKQKLKQDLHTSYVFLFYKNQKGKKKEKLNRASHQCFFTL